MKFSAKRPSRSGVYVVYNKPYDKYELLLLCYSKDGMERIS